MKMASRSIDLIRKNKQTNKQTNCMRVQHTFYSNLQENKLASAARFLSFFDVVLHNYNAVLKD